jgi:nucleoside-diphosphate-sugar epimerase
MNNLLVIGAGYSARQCAIVAAKRYAAMSGTTRDPRNFDALKAAGLQPLQFDGSGNGPLSEAIARATHLLVSAGPNDSGDPVLNVLGEEILAAPNLAWIAYLSTVGVYGDHDGKWIDENTAPKPVSQRSVERLAAEKAWQELARRRDIPLAIFRLSGIYGPGRNAFVNIVAGTSRRLVKPGQVFNRIHRDDIARAFDLAAQQSVDGIFNITDDEPAPPQDVVAYAHELAGIAPPPEQDFASAQLSPMARSFYGENKRVANAKSKRDLAMEYAYPNYRAALERMWRDNSWR